MSLSGRDHPSTSGEKAAYSELDEGDIVTPTAAPRHGLGISKASIPT